MLSYPPKGTVRFLLETAFAVLVFAGGTLAVQAGPPIFADDDGLGTGLLMFALYALVAFVWGGLDGWRRRPLAWIAVRWVVVSLVTSTVGTLYISWGYIHEHAASFVSELIAFGFFLLGLIGAVAIAGGYLGRQIGRSRSTAPKHSNDHATQ
ncbi:hypothetical protein [Microlunatus ginsengisoli]|uniref:Uncharacterized protein n=1 Tax=Microlunatus ginsengisoli TaxID=363863 RepID=A0ABP7AD81_9ACTN